MNWWMNTLLILGRGYLITQYLTYETGKIIVPLRIAVLSASEPKENLYTCVFHLLWTSPQQVLEVGRVFHLNIALRKPELQRLNNLPKVTQVGRDTVEILSLFESLSLFPQEFREWESHFIKLMGTKASFTKEVHLSWVLKNLREPERQRKQTQYSRWKEWLSQKQRNNKSIQGLVSGSFEIKESPEEGWNHIVKTLNWLILSTIIYWVPAMCETWGQVTGEGTKHLATRPHGADGLAACYTDSVTL